MLILHVHGCHAMLVLIPNVYAVCGAKIVSGATHEQRDVSTGLGSAVAGSSATGNFVLSEGMLLRFALH